MIVRQLASVPSIDWGNGLSRRFLLQSDGLGYSITDTIVRAGTKSKLEYRSHLESCYCIEGSGEVIDVNGSSHPIRPGTMYSLNDHDPHWLIASKHQDLRLVCVFAPALKGTERHSLDTNEFSQY